MGTTGIPQRIARDRKETIESINICTQESQGKNEAGSDQTISPHDNYPSDWPEIAAWQSNNEEGVDSKEGSVEQTYLGCENVELFDEVNDDAETIEPPPDEDERCHQTEVDETSKPEDEKSEGERYNLTDAGNGLRLVDMYQNDIRYCTDDKVWYVWDGTRWQRDGSGQIRELSKGVATAIRKEANAMEAPKRTHNRKQDSAAMAEYERRKDCLLKWSDQSENADRVTKTIRSAESDAKIICKRADFDRDPNLLNCANGVVNLRTGTLIPHHQALMMSNLCPHEYDPNARHQVWDQSLEAFTRNHLDLLPFLKSTAGYSIQGAKTEERIIILHGKGHVGKGTFLDCLMYALGPDYACAMDASSVVKQKRNSAAASGDIARLQGKRLVVVSEIEKGSQLQESFMKLASGNDSIVARGMYMSEREFRPTHQFWFQTNYRPGFDSTDSGNKRRYIEIPFDNILSMDPLVKLDTKLKLRMREDKDFLKAVLAWTVAGAVEWNQHGLKLPKSVEDATAALFAHNDFLSAFLEETCVVRPHLKAPIRDVWDAYRRWCDEQGDEPAQKKTFNQSMEERGFKRKQARFGGSTGKAWTGIRLNGSWQKARRGDLRLKIA